MKNLVNFPYPIAIDISKQVRLWYHYNSEFKDENKTYLIGYIYTDDCEFTKSAKTDILLSLYQMVFREHYPEIKNSFNVGIGYGFKENYLSVAFVGENRELVKGFHEFFIHLRTFNLKCWEYKKHFENYKLKLQ